MTTTNKDTINKETTYINCDRCGEQLQLSGEIANHVRYKNGLICLQCSFKRKFDDDNPIMYD